VTAPAARAHRPAAQRRRDALLQAATEIAGESGAGAATHRAVAARAGLPPATTSYFFASITELMEEALRAFVAGRTEELAGLLAGLPEGSTPDEVAAAFASVLLAGDRTSELAQIEAYLHAARGDGLRGAVADAMAAFEAAAEEALRVAGARDPAAGARRFMALSDGFVLQHLANPRPDDEAELAAALRALFLGGEV
jgi:DNA-binding transcriptional regulator YbjK